MAGIGCWANESTEPVPALLVALAGTVVTFLATVAGRAAPVTELSPAADDGDEEPEFTLTRTMTSTMAMTARTAVPAIRTRRRVSARRAAACCWAIRSRALPCLIRCDLLM